MESDSFLQSQEWGQLQEAMDRKIWRIGNTLVIKHNLSLGKNYLYSPRGPVDSVGSFLKEVKKIAQEEKSIFLKVEPENELELKNLGFIKSEKEIQPSKTVSLDISKPEEELLSQMHHKTRYNIRLAKKKGIQIGQGDSKDLDSFFSLLKETAQRDKFHLHPDDYYRKIFEILGAKLFLARYQNKVIAASLVYFSNQTATYLHGTSDYNTRKLMAPYLLQWQSILKAKESDLKYYDFYGINQDKWPGVTRFKKGFGGKEISYPGSFDLVYSSFWYEVYKIARKIL